MKKLYLNFLISGVVLSGLSATGCEKRPKQEVPIASERDAVTQFGKAIEQARDLSAAADNKNEELTAQLDQAIEE